MLGVSLGTVRKWQLGTIQPSGAARTLLKIVAKHPAIAREYPLPQICQAR